MRTIPQRRPIQGPIEFVDQDGQLADAERLMVMRRDLGDVVVQEMAASAMDQRIKQACGVE